MKVNIIIFGQMVDVTGSSTLLIENVSTTDELVEKLHLQFPAMATAKYAIAVDKKMIRENTSITNNSMVALLPPFSGG